MKVEVRAYTDAASDVMLRFSVGGAGGRVDTVLPRAEAIRLADEIYEKLGPVKREGAGVYYSTLAANNETPEKLCGEAQAQRDDHMEHYARANQKDHEKDEEITSLIAKLATSVKESAEKGARISELNALCSIPAEDLKSRIDQLTEALSRSRAESFTHENRWRTLQARVREGLKWADKVGEWK